jgi:Fe-S-cluster containining protein
VSNVRTPRDARWSCTRCGACCRSFTLGPVEPAVIDALTEADIAARWPPAAEAPWHLDGYLTHRDGACVFLMDDSRCFLHVTLGAASKPGFCRQFPFELVRDPSGIVATARPDCAGFSRSHVTGAPLSEGLSDLAGVAVSVPRFAPETVVILPGHEVSLSDWMDLEADLLADLYARDTEPAGLIAATRRSLGIEGEGDPARARLAMRAVLAALSSALAQAPDDAFTRQMRSFAAKASAMELPEPLSAPGQAYLNLLLRSHIQGKAFVPYGSVAAGLGLFVLNARIARLVDPTDPGAALSAWVRFSLNRTLHPLLSRAAPALVDIFRFASDSGLPADQ